MAKQCKWGKAYFMRKSVLFILFMITVLLAACGGEKKEDSLEENSKTSVDQTDHETQEDADDMDNELSDENDDASSDGDMALVDVSLDISEGITEAYDFFDKLYFSDTEIIDEEIALKSAEVTVYLDDPSKNSIATLRAHTIEPQNSMNLSVGITSPEDFEEKLTKTDADGNDMAVEVADGAYEYAEKLIWKKDDLVYELDGGRSVVSTNKENEIHPEDDRLSFYENLVPTNNELKTYDEFYQNIKMPTQLPEDFTVGRVTLIYDQPLGLSKEPPARILYEAKGPNHEVITFLVYGEYEEAPPFKGDQVSEENILGIPVQIDEEKLLFTLDDETHEIHYMEVPEETILEIVESIIEQAE